LVKGGINNEKLHSELNDTHCHRRVICVPVPVPPKFARHFGNGSGLQGVDFVLRTVGRAMPTAEAEADDEDGAEMIDDVGDHGGHGDVNGGLRDPHLMSSRELRLTFKDDTAEIQSALFQQPTLIAPPAKFLEKHLKVLPPCMMRVSAVG
jgi:hypothetical protein